MAMKGSLSCGLIQEQFYRNCLCKDRFLSPCNFQNFFGIDLVTVGFGSTIFIGFRLKKYKFSVLLLA